MRLPLTFLPAKGAPFFLDSRRASYPDSQAAVPSLHPPPPFPPREPPFHPLRTPASDLLARPLLPCPPRPLTPLYFSLSSAGPIQCPPRVRSCFYIQPRTPRPSLPSVGPPYQLPVFHLPAHLRIILLPRPPSYIVHPPTPYSLPSYGTQRRARFSDPRGAGCSAPSPWRVVLSAVRYAAIPQPLRTRMARDTNAELWKDEKPLNIELSCAADSPARSEPRRAAPILPPGLQGVSFNDLLSTPRNLKPAER